MKLCFSLVYRCRTSLLCLLLLSPVVLPAQQILSREGVAYNGNDHRHAFRIVNITSRETAGRFGQDSEYSFNGTTFARQGWRRISGYYIGEYRFTNHKTGREESIALKDNQVLISFRRSDREDVVRNTIPLSENMVHDVGIIIYILENWDTLLQTEKDISVVVPSRQTQYTFVLEWLYTRNGKTVFAMEPANFLLRQFIPTFTFTFATPTRKLLQMEGWSHVSLTEEIQTVRINYR